jgi:hypothetical protein
LRDGEEGHILRRCVIQKSYLIHTYLSHRMFSFLR